MSYLSTRPAMAPPVVYRRNDPGLMGLLFRGMGSVGLGQYSGPINTPEGVQTVNLSASDLLGGLALMWHQSLSQVQSQCGSDGDACEGYLTNVVQYIQSGLYEYDPSTGDWSVNPNPTPPSPAAGAAYEAAAAASPFVGPQTSTSGAALATQQPAAVAAATQAVASGANTTQAQQAAIAAATTAAQQAAAAQQAQAAQQSAIAAAAAQQAAAQQQAAAAPVTTPAPTNPSNPPPSNPTTPTPGTTTSTASSTTSSSSSQPSQPIDLNLGPVTIPASDLSDTLQIGDLNVPYWALGLGALILAFAAYEVAK